MVKKKGRRIAKRGIIKRVKKSSQKLRKKVKDVGFLEKKRRVSVVNLIMSLIAFVIFLVLYFMVSNYALKVLFGLGALITGALSLIFLLVIVAVFIYTRTHKNS